MVDARSYSAMYDNGLVFYGNLLWIFSLSLLTVLLLRFFLGRCRVICWLIVSGADNPLCLDDDEDDAK